MVISLQSLITILLVGGIAGWLAGLIMKGRGFGVAGNIVIGIIGAFVGGWVLGILGIHIGGGLIAAVLNAMIGSVILLFVIGLIKRA